MSRVLFLYKLGHIGRFSNLHYYNSWCLKKKIYKRDMQISGSLDGKKTRVWPRNCVFRYHNFSLGVSLDENNIKKFSDFFIYFAVFFRTLTFSSSG